METRKAFARSFMQRPEFQQWKASNPHYDDRQVYEAYENANARLGSTMYALSYLWPDFVEMDGLILRDPGRSPEEWQQYLESWRDGELSPEAIESTINHLHVWDTFSADPDRQRFDESVWEPFAQTIAEMWRGRLRQLFPEKRFEVGVYEGYGPEVYAFTVRDEPR